jgi:hypothetical protein
MTRPPLIYFALLSTLSPACKDGDDAAAGDDKTAAAPEAAMDVAAINAAVPADLQKAIRFVETTGDEGRIRVAAPEGWESEHIPGSYRPPRGSGLGFFTGFSAGSNCNGACAPKDWKATADEVDFAQFGGEGFEVVVDEAIDGGRFLEAKKDGSVYLRFAWYKQDASRYFFCRATLEDAAVGARPAFERACRSMAIGKWE